MQAPPIPPTAPLVEHPSLSRPICFCARHKRYIAYSLTAACLYLDVSWSVWFALVVGTWSLFLAYQWKAFNRAVYTYRQRGTIFVVHAVEDVALTRAQALVSEIEKSIARQSKPCTVKLHSSSDFEPWLLLTGSYTIVFVTAEESSSSPSSSAALATTIATDATNDKFSPTSAASNTVLKLPSSPSSSATTTSAFSTTVAESDRFLLWLLNEKSTRLTVSALTGWNTNIVYTEEGKRRTAFQRLNYAVIPCPCEKEEHTVEARRSPLESFRPLGVELSAPRLSRQVDGYLEAFTARRICADAESLVAASTVSVWTEDFPPLEAFVEWALACPCCDQVTVERGRERPSNLRIPFWRQKMLFFTDPSMRGQLIRYYKQVWDGIVATYKSYELTWSRARIVFLSHAPPPPPPPPLALFQWDCAFGDPELVDETGISELDVSGWSLNPNFVLSEGVGRESPYEVDYEFAAPFPGPQLCVTHPLTKAVAVYQVTVDEELKLLQGLKTRTDLSDVSPTLKAWLVQCLLWVPPSLHTAWQTVEAKAQADLHEKGWTVFDSCSLVPAPFLRALRRHYRGMEPYLFECVLGSPSQRSYNDEPVARQIQSSLTAWVQHLTQTPLAHSSLALSIFIRPGQGFIFHTDTSPPFDITLDIAVDHVGPSTRPLYFTRPNPKGGLVPIVEKLELRFGEAVLFRGSELTHWGGDMGADSQHKVILGTWQFVKD